MKNTLEPSCFIFIQLMPPSLFKFGRLSPTTHSKRKMCLHSYLCDMCCQRCDSNVASIVPKINQQLPCPSVLPLQFEDTYLTSRKKKWTKSWAGVMCLKQWSSIQLPWEKICSIICYILNYLKRKHQEICNVKGSYTLATAHL